MKEKPKLYLASASPRRKQLLEALGLNFEIISAPVEEIDPSADSADQGVIENAQRKSAAGLKGLNGKQGVVIAADTLVIFKDTVLGKPKNREEVLSMLTLLSGKTHRVVTGLVLQSTTGVVSQAAVSSFVTFREIAPEERESYAATREPYDKAGSYAIQGLGTIFIQRIEGSYTNIMGLPIEKFLEELPQASGVPIYEWFH